MGTTHTLTGVEILGLHANGAQKDQGWRENFSLRTFPPLFLLILNVPITSWESSMKEFTLLSIRLIFLPMIPGKHSENMFLRAIPFSQFSLILICFTLSFLTSSILSLFLSVLIRIKKKHHKMFLIRIKDDFEEEMKGERVRVCQSCDWEYRKMMISFEWILFCLLFLSFFR